ncbi:MAG: hypothetical protein LBU84_12445 [Prevotella sp.]|nr:hypothetical protein [Prevotella sp.]
MFTKMLFPNIAVKDVKKSMEFFSQLGFSYNEKFTDENAACMIINEMACVMLLKEPFYLSFTNKSLADTSKTSEVMLAIMLESKEQVDETLSKALSLGASEGRKEDLGFMYSRSFHDLDGHIWEFGWMDEAAV